MASLFLENLELARTLLSKKPSQLSEANTFKLNLKRSVCLIRVLKLFNSLGPVFFLKKTGY